MIAPRFIPLVLRHVTRHRARSFLTAAGVATAMFLFCTTESLQQGLQSATRENAADTTLVVYRADRYCPFTSNLPEYYLPRIEQIPGVSSVVPMKVAVNNCRASLDVVTFRGVPAAVAGDAFRANGVATAADVDKWLARTDAALLGPVLARRRGLAVGDRFDANGLTVSVAGILTSEEPQDQNVAYVHLEFMQYAPGQKQAGIVTQFNVKVDDPVRMSDVAAAIDAEFASDSEPTETRSEKAFVARAAGDILGLVAFTRIVGFGCVIAVLALVANTIAMAARDRVRDHAVLQTLGFRGGLIARLIVAEGLVLALAGGLVGSLGAMAFLNASGLSLSSEGLSINFEASLATWLTGLGMSGAAGVLASLVPAWSAGRRDIVESFRSV